MPKLNGIYSGCSVYTYPYNVYGQADAFLEDVITSGDYASVVSIVMVPTALFSDGEWCKTDTVDITFPRTVNGYTPRNKKLLTYPYAYLNVDTFEDNKDYRYEWFPEYREGLADTGFFHSGCLGPNPEAVFYPMQYQDMGAAGGSNFDCQSVGVTMSGFPQCSFPIDSYRAWVAQKSTQAGLNLAGQAIGTVANVASGNLVGAMMGAIGLAGSLDAMTKSQVNSSRVQGNQVSSVSVGTRAKNVLFKKMSITKEYARSIDDFFDRYGYTTERLKVPNRAVRPHWTYTKTKNCAIAGKVPGMYAQQIEAIYNQGVTFWKNISEVGDYNLSNSV